MTIKNVQSLGKSRIQTVHFIGIGGAGMSGIAEVLLHEGYKITGSDLSDNASTRRLQKLGATIFKNHNAKNIEQAQVVVRSTAIQDDNCEIVAARKHRIPVVARAEMLAELMRFRYGIAIAGTHGKTTTTSLVASLLSDAGLDPTYVIGGLLNSSGSNARLGKNDIMVVEADESDASFLYLKPMMTIVTNIDADHMQTYHNDFNELRQTFLDFIHHLPFYGLAVMCLDDPVVQELLPEINRQVITYGFHPNADLQACDFKQHETISKFICRYKKYNIEIPMSLNLPGKHNVQNALASIAVAVEFGVDVDNITSTFNTFAGIGRRFHKLGDLAIDEKRITLIDDYGHHPREIAATIQAARDAWPTRRLVMIFQPHRYSRTQELFDDFVRELSTLDLLVMLNVYPAGEQEIPGADSASICRSIRQRSKLDPILVTQHDELSGVLRNVLRHNDVLLAQGAGSVSSIIRSIQEQFENE